MANSTYLALTNKLLQQFQEVEIGVSDWTSVRGLQAYAKTAINHSLRKIYSKEHYWPFNHADGTQTLTAGTQLYAWPADFKIVDWNSFQIQKDDTLSVTAQVLYPIDKEEWFARYKDLDTTTPSRNKPEKVFKAHGNYWGVTPSPDKAYVINFDYYKQFVPLDAYTDQTDITPDFEHVILYGAASHMNLLLDNNEQAQLMDKEYFKPSLIEMRTVLINDDLRLRDTRVRY
jgi:hypothetical protein